MLRIEVIGKKGGFLDVKPGTKSPITISAQEIRKVGEKKGTFSKTITLAETKNNGVMLGFLFAIEVISSDFDVNKRVNVRLFNGQTEIEGNFFMQLTKIIKKKQRVTGYEVSVKNEVADFFGTIAQNYLHDLDFSDGNHILTAANVVTGLGHYQGDAVYTYHLTANSDNNYQLKQFKPAFFARDIWDRIHARAGKAYEWDNMDDDKTNFSKLIIPSNTDPISGTEEQETVRATRASWIKTATGTGVVSTILNEEMIVDTEVLDQTNSYNPTTGIYQSPVNIPTGTSVLFNLSFNYKVEVVNHETETVTLKNTGVGTPFVSFTPYVVGRKNTVAHGQQIVTTNIVTKNAGTTIPSLGSLVIYDQQVTVPLTMTNFLATDLMGVGQRLITNYGNNRWRKSGAVDASISHKITITGITLEIKPNAGNGYGFGQFIELNKFMPRQIKQSDFISAIMTMNNLIVDEKRSTENKIVYQKRDEYYDAGEVKKWKLDFSKEYDISFVNEQTAKRQILTYKQDKDEPNTGYQAQTGEIYGQVEYTFKSEFNKGVETTEIVFSPTPLAPTSFGAVVPLFSGANPNTNIRVLYKGEKLACQPWTITEFTGSTVTITDGYNYAGHFDNPIEPNFDLNFSVCDYYFYPWLLRKTNNNLFSLNWRRHFHQIDNGKVLTGYFYLNALDIKNIKLNDKIFVLNQYWNINKIIDFDPNGTSRLTKCELMSVEDLAKIKTRTRIPFVAGGGSAILNPVRDIVKKVAGQLNSLPALSNLLVLGKNVSVDDSVKNAVIIGDDVQANESGLYAPTIFFPDGSSFSSTADLSSVIEVGVTPILGGVTGRLLIDKAGVIKETELKTVDGSEVVGTGNIDTKNIGNNDLTSNRNLAKLTLNGSTDGNTFEVWNGTEAKLKIDGTGKTTIKSSGTGLVIDAVAGQNAIDMTNGAYIRLGSGAAMIRANSTTAFQVMDSAFGIKLNVAWSGQGSYFNTPLSINKTTTATARLHIGAGAIGAGNAPLKIDSGTLQTTPEAGTVEYNGTFHATNSDATRRHFVLAPNTTKVTAGGRFTNDGYIVVRIGGTDFKLMTTA